MIRQDWSTLKKLMFLKAAAGGGSAAVERYANGNPVVFGTDLARPLKEMLINLLPVQSGSGDPSPQNIRSILPWNGLTVFGGGKNLLECEIGATKSNNGVDYVVLPNHGINCKGETVTYSSYGIDSKKIQLKAGTYAFSVSGATNVKTVFVKNSAYWFEISGSGSSAKTITVDSEVYCHFMVTSGNEVDETVFVQLEVGSTASSYEEYKPITETAISFQSPVYGGTLDVVSGVLTVTHGMVINTGQTGEGGESWGMSISAGKNRAVRSKANFDYAPKNGSPVFASYMKDSSQVAEWNGWFASTTGNFLCYVPDEIDTVDKWRAYLAENPLVLVYELATPQEITLTPEQITAIKGNNTIWSDANGAINLTYLVSGKYAEDHPVGGLGSGLGSGLLGAGTEPEEPIEDPTEEPEE